MLVVKSWKQNKTEIISADRMKQNCGTKHLAAQLGFVPAVQSLTPRSRLACGAASALECALPLLSPPSFLTSPAALSPPPSEWINCAAAT